METAVDGLGLVETEKPVTGKRRRPRAKAGSKYKFVAGIKRSRKYKEYFDPEQDITMRLARLGDLVRPTKLLLLVYLRMRMWCSLQDGSGEPSVDSGNGCVTFTLYDRFGSASDRVNINEGQSQTQPETQSVANTETRPKRKSREERDGRAKRVKISLGDAMDLGD